MVNLFIFVLDSMWLRWSFYCWDRSATDDVDLHQKVVELLIFGFSHLCKFLSLSDSGGGARFKQPRTVEEHKKLVWWAWWIFFWKAMNLFFNSYVFNFLLLVFIQMLSWHFKYLVLYYYVCHGYPTMYHMKFFVSELMIMIELIVIWK